MHSIGEFSRITSLTIKSLRFYHEQGVLLPAHVDEKTGYRYYDDAKVETARVIAALRRLDISVGDITKILESFDEEADILEFLQQHRQTIETKMQHYKSILKSIDQVITNAREARTAMQHATFNVEEKTLQPVLVAGIRMKGKYSDCGKGFSQIGRRFGFRINGKPMLLIYDNEYKEDDADFEPCMPIRKGDSKDGIDVRELPGGRCVTLLHQGPYDSISRSYEQILEFVHDKGYEITVPCREVYIKGPGMIFKGNPKNYLTEIQMLVKE